MHPGMKKMMRPMRPEERPIRRPSPPTKYGGITKKLTKKKG